MGKGYIHRTIKAILGRREAENATTESKTMKHSFVRNRLKTMGLIQMALPIFLVSYFIVFPINWLLVIAGILTGFLFWTITMAGFHRVLSHNIVKTNNYIKAFYCFIGSMAAASPPIAWAATHIMHHNHFGTDKDPQNPNVYGWKTMFFYFAPSFAEVMDKLTITEKKKFLLNIKHLIRDPILLFFEKNYLVITLMYIILLSIIHPSMVIYFYVIPVIYTLLGHSLLVGQHIEGIDNKINLMYPFYYGEHGHDYHHEAPGGPDGLNTLLRKAFRANGRR